MRVFLLALALSLSACGGGSDAPDPDADAAFDAEVDAELVVPARRNAMAYDVGRIEAPAGATVRLVMDNSTTTSPAMIHNVVVLENEDAIERVGIAAVGAENNLPDDPAILAATGLAGPGERTAVVFTMPPAGEYPFICTYTGHFRLMQGTLVSTPA